MNKNKIAELIMGVGIGGGLSVSTVGTVMLTNDVFQFIKKSVITIIDGRKRSGDRTS